MQKLHHVYGSTIKLSRQQKFYTLIFKNSKVGDITLYGNEGYEIHGRKAGSVATVEFEIEGQEFVALNGGPIFKFNEAFHSKYIVRRKKKWIIIGRNFPRAVMKRRSNAVGSKTNTGYHGKSFPQF